MPTISLRFKEEDLAEINQHAHKLHMSRTEYVRQAVIAMNKKVEREIRRQRIMEASKRVRGGSMKINAEFDLIEDMPDV
jgi:hypothetical protein